MTGVAVVGMDPGFGGGVQAQAEAFWRAAAELGREPSYHYVAHPSLAGVPRAGSPLNGPGVPAPFGRLDFANLLAAGRSLGPQVRGARSCWVVSTTAPYGYPALRSRRPYACWLGAGLREEWAGRRPGLPLSRRLALRANAPVLLRLERSVLRGAVRVYATGPSSRRELARAAAIDEDAIGVLPIPIDLDRFRPLADEQWSAGLEEPVLAFVGRADDPRKNVALLLETLPLVRQHIPNARLRLVGRAPRTALPAGVEATGPVGSVADELRGAALLVLPARHEGFGIVAAEALASGVPVVATPSGGPEHLLAASGGGVVLSSFSAGEFAERVVELLESPARLLTMRASGREYVAREHSPERFRTMLAAAFGELEG